MKTVTSLTIQSFIIFLAMFLSVPVMAMTLTYATNTAPSGLRGDAEKIFLEELEKASNGKLTIKPFWAESLVKGKEIMKAIDDGIVDMGHVNIAYNPKRLMRNSGFLLINQGPEDYKSKINAFRRIYTEIPSMTEEITKFNQRTVYTYNPTSIGYCFTKPVKNIDDFKNLKIRASSKYSLSVLKELGAVPVSLPWGDLYIALQTNSIQGVITNMDSIHRAKLHEVAPNVMLFNKLWVPIPYLININEKKWKKLSPEMKKAFKVAAVNAENRFALEYEKWQERIIKDMMDSGSTIVMADDADYKKFLNASTHSKNEKAWIDAVSEGGVGNSSEILEKMKSIVAEEIK